MISFAFQDHYLAALWQLGLTGGGALIWVLAWMWQ